jgi:protein-arginine kinase activator protein McsA
MTQEEFLLKARSVHGEQYDYSQIVYINSRTKVEVGCRVCGRTFHQIPKDHIRSGCKGCGNTEKLSQEDWVLRARKVHGEKHHYAETVCIIMRTKVKIGCRRCGRTFEQIPKSDMKHGYFKCRKLRPPGGMSQETFLLKAKSVHGEKYDYSKSIYINSKTKLEIRCRESGHGTFMHDCVNNAMWTVYFLIQAVEI